MNIGCNIHYAHVSLNKGPNVDAAVEAVTIIRLQHSDQQVYCNLFVREGCVSSEYDMQAEQSKLVQ